MGAWIGLEQDPNGREPAGGWRWITGEPLSFTNWMKDMPNENRSGDDFAMFYAQKRVRADLTDVAVSKWDDMGPSNSTYSFIIEYE